MKSWDEKNGMKKLPEELDKLYLKDESSFAYIAYEIFVLFVIM